MEDPNAMGGEDQMMGCDPNVMGGDMGMDDTNAMGEDPNAIGSDGATSSPFDTNFDAGVEADEETDPKHFIQQLTGKLSTSLNSFNNENGEPDEGLCKYVGKMIVKQAAKGLDDAGRKELIAAINSTDSETDDDMDSNEGIEDDSIGGTESGEIPADGENMEQQDNQMLEYVLTKKQILKLNEVFNQDTLNRKDKNLECNRNKKKNSTFSGKRFMK